MNEADTCRTLVRPKLESAGWDGGKHFYSEQTPFTDGRIVAPAGKPRRLKKKLSDFLLRYTRDITLTVVEAKSDRGPAGTGLQQTESHATILALKFAYATNNRGRFLYVQKQEGDWLPIAAELWFRCTKGLQKLLHGAKVTQ